MIRFMDVSTKDSLMKRIITFAAIGLCTMTASAQNNGYAYVSHAEYELQAAKKFTPRRMKISQPWYEGLNTLQFTPSADGGGTAFAWGDGLSVNYNGLNCNFTSWDVEGCRNFPTGNTAITFTATGLSIKCYNDVQLATDFDEATGGPKVPDDPCSSRVGCKSGTAQRDFDFTIGDNTYTAKASVTCSHQHRVIFVTRGGWNSKRRQYVGGGSYSGNAGNFLSPQKFSHTQTISISYAALAKAAGMTESEMFRRILDKGISYVDCQRFVRKGDYSLFSLLFYRMAAKKCGVTKEQLRQEYFAMSPSRILKSLQERRDELNEHAEMIKAAIQFNDAVYFRELMEFKLPESKQLMDDYTTFYSRMVSDHASKRDIAKIRQKRIDAMHHYYETLELAGGTNAVGGPNITFQQLDKGDYEDPNSIAVKAFNAVKANDPDPTLRNIRYIQLEKIMKQYEADAETAKEFYKVLDAWSEPLLGKWNPAGSTVRTAITRYNNRRGGAGIPWGQCSSIEQAKEMHDLLADSLMLKYRSAMRLRETGNEHYLHYKDQDAQTVGHLVSAAKAYIECVNKLFEVVYYNEIGSLQVSPDAPSEVKDFDWKLVPADTLKEAKERLLTVGKQIVFSLYRLYYVTGGKNEELLGRYYSLMNVKGDISHIKYPDGTSWRLSKNSFDAMYFPDGRASSFYSSVLCVNGMIMRPDDEYNRYYYRMLEPQLLVMDAQYGNFDRALARGNLLLWNKELVADDNILANVTYILSKICMDTEKYDEARRYNSDFMKYCKPADSTNQLYLEGLEMEGLILLKKNDVKGAKKYLKDLQKGYKDVDWIQRPLYKSLRELGEVK